jgi:hypothetical protein
VTDIPDLRSLLAEASRPASSVTVPLKQGLRERIEALEAELAAIATDAPRKRMGAKSPLTLKAEEIEALRQEMQESALTFRFEAMTNAQRDQIRQDMKGRDDPDEMNLRAIAAMCVSVTGPDGKEFPDRMTWEDFAALRDRLGAHVFDVTIDAAADRAGGAQWSVPFSLSASHILGTER